MNGDELWYTSEEKRFTQCVLPYLQGCYMPLLVPLYNICDRCALCLSIDFKYKCKYYDSSDFVDQSLLVDSSGEEREWWHERGETIEL